MTVEYLFMDTETYSECDLKKCGVYAYAEHPSTEIIICTYAFDDGKVQEWDVTAGGRMPRDLRRALRSVVRGGIKLVGQNFLQFDRLVMRECWGVDIPVTNIIDTMIEAFRLALPGSLAGLCTALNIPQDLAKDKDGKRLIQRFSKPTPKNYKIRRYTAATHPDDWKRFLSYARSDIHAMREVFYRLPTWGATDKENEILALDQLVNDRGFFVDSELAESAVAAVKQHKLELQREAMASYGGSLTGAAFLPILRDLAPAWDIPNAQKSTLQGLIDDPELPGQARVLVEMRLGASSTASTKYNPLLLGRSRDGRRRGCIQYGGAKRTLRFAGKGFQPQNLARGYFSNKDDVGNYTGELDLGIRLLKRGRAARAFDISKLTATTVRSCIVPEPGNKFVVADYSNVEGRGLAWLAGEESALKTFRAGIDIYCATAGKMFGMDPDEIKKKRKDLRQIGKACELGLGYAGGVAAFITFAKNLGLDLHQMAETMSGTFPDNIWRAARKGYEFARIREKNKRAPKGQKPDRPSYDLPKKVWMTCDAIKRMWRESHPETVKFWADVENGAQSAIRNPGKSYWAGAHVRTDGNRAVKITRTVRNGEPGWWLKVELPSGRIMSYPGIGISVEKEEDEDTGEIRTSTRIKYLGENQTTRQWGWLYTYSGKLVENITQALCRDLLAEALLKVEAAGYPIVLHVHDEIIAETPNSDDYTVEGLAALMCALPEWAEGFPLAAEGEEMFRYAK